MEVDRGVVEVAFYIARLKAHDRQIAWRPGLSLLAPTPLRVPEFPFILLDLSIAAAGVIAYEPRPDYQEGAKWGVSAFIITMMILTLRNGGAPSDSIPVPALAPA